MDNLTLLGKSGVTQPTEKLESFKRPSLLKTVVMISDEVTALCPITNQPDQYTVEIVYTPRDLCIESKSLKLKLQSLRQTGIFCENLSTQLVEHIVESIHPMQVSVTVIQKPRGGVSIHATSQYP